MKKWEYKRKIGFVWNEMEIMQVMGEEGWELCACWLWWLYFKRPTEYSGDTRRNPN